MGFQQGLSGLDAASKQLDVIGNNIANASTVGFKSSVAQFGDMYASSFYGVANTEAGIGVMTEAVSQQMTQGDVTSTTNNLDMAINNNGFFILQTGNVDNTNGTTSGQLVYTRDGEFQVNNNGYIVDANGNYLQGWMASGSGVVTQGTLSNMQLQTALIAPNSTTAVKMGVNLDTNDTTPTDTTFSPTDTASYTWSNSTTVYDAQGNAHSLTNYYVKSATSNTWKVYPYVDGTAASVTPKGGTAGTSETLTFSGTGALTNTDQPLSISFTPSNGATTPDTFTLDYSGSTQYGEASSTTALTNDGYASGTVSSINIGATGIVQASYTNGQTKTVGQIALATFTNQQGLQAIGSNNWEQTFASGPAQVNAPGAGTAGTLTDSAVEASNVNLTDELVNMITAQRYYQANAQTIQTQNSILQTLESL